MKCYIYLKCLLQEIIPVHFENTQLADYFLCIFGIGNALFIQSIVEQTGKKKHRFNDYSRVSTIIATSQSDYNQL